MDKIYVNQKVIDRYRAGAALNDAIFDEYRDEIINRRSGDDKEAYIKMTPLQMAMHDAGITKYSTVKDLFETATYTSGGLQSNEWLFPAWTEATLKEATYETSILSYICDTSIGIDGNIVKSASLNLLDANNKPNVKKVRIAEGADIPTAKIKVGEKAITLWKHGRAIEMTYESVRRMRIDIFAKHLNAIVSDIAFQGFEDAIDTAVNGDGNNNAATSLGTLGTANTITANELVGFMIDYWNTNHFAADTITVPLAFYKQIFNMTYDIELAPGASQKLLFNLPQLGVQTVNVLTGNIPQVGGKDIILFTNKANTLIRYEENGSNLQENQSFADRKSVV